MAAAEPALTLRGDARLRRRRIVNRLAEAGATIAALVAVLVLGIVVWSIAKRGGSELSWGFLTKDLPLFGQPGGGIFLFVLEGALCQLQRDDRVDQALLGPVVQIANHPSALLVGRRHDPRP